MPYYMTQVSYTAEAWAAQIKDPRDPRERVRPVVEALGGTLVSAWYALGEYEAMTIAQYPDNVTVAAVSMAVAAGGGMKSIKITPLMTVEEGLEAMKKAGKAGYRPPGG